MKPAGGRGAPGRNPRPAQAASRQKLLARLARSLQDRIEIERAAIAREIHDDVGGTLAAVKLDLAWIARHSESLEVLEHVGSATDAVDHAIEASKRIMHNLHPSILEQGLVPAVQWLARQFERRSGVETVVQGMAEPLALPAGVPLVAYRFVQESLTNVQKHARARHVVIELALAGGVLTVEVRDDGIGVDAAACHDGDGVGLQGLEERARTVGGWVDVLGTPGAGTTLMLSVPIDARARGAVRAPPGRKPRPGRPASAPKGKP